MGALAPRSAHARPSAQARIDTNEKHSAKVSGGGEKKKAISDTFSRHFSTFSTFLFFEKRTPKKSTQRKLSEPYDNPFWQQSKPAERERREDKNH
jgi:hypothetical protein